MQNNESVKTAIFETIELWTDPSHLCKLDLHSILSIYVPYIQYFEVASKPLRLAGNG